MSANQIKVFSLLVFTGYVTIMTNMKEDLEDMKHNPWLVTNLEDFLYYNCPECDNKTQSKAVFINHAYLNHPRVSELSELSIILMSKLKKYKNSNITLEEVL